MAKLNNVEIHFKHSNRTYNTMTAFLVMTFKMVNIFMLVRKSKSLATREVSQFTYMKAMLGLTNIDVAST